MICFNNDAKAIYQNLKDAGCDDELISSFMKIDIKEDAKVQLQLLTKQRRILLDKLHQSQKELDCLDYLIFKIKKASI